ncbi:MAG: CAP domain-containing protein [Pseudomonadota bacterium]
MVLRHLTLVLAAVMLAGCFSFGLQDAKLEPIPRNAERERTVNAGEAIRAINGFRISRGRAPLRMDPKLNAVAASTAREMARRRQIKTEMHTTAGLQRRLDAANYPASAAAENLAGGFPTLDQAIEGWKGSRGHRRNLLNRNVTHAGIGLVVTDSGHRSYWVLLFARPETPGGPA